MATITRTLTASAHVAVAVRLKDPERETVARRNLAEAQIADAIDRALTTAPPLNPGQIRTLTTLLKAGGQR
ncbi:MULTISPECIES: hypothetical protein [Microbacterium]|uniref:hypothetical protein n=1 Tax=Microbacterium TaxID=33882 RepID=UPI000F5DF186|nr:MULTISPECIES: hypothetical protein [Microbacterium]AZH79146.1 hypothetical protein CSX12_12165 [Microbacterium sp. Y-01]MBM7464988.1 hypothetical protein [Microbacterium esteraromaticum]